jgi:hypothetical protein
MNQRRLVVVVARRKSSDSCCCAATGGERRDGLGATTATRPGLRPSEGGCARPLTIRCQTRKSLHGKASRATSPRHLCPAGHRHYVTVTNLMCRRAAADSGRIPHCRIAVEAVVRCCHIGVEAVFRRCQLIVDSETNSCRGDAAGSSLPTSRRKSSVSVRSRTS